MFKKLLNKLRGKEDQKTSTKKRSSKKKLPSKSKKSSDSEYANRFQRFYHLNKKRLNKERRGDYKSKSNSGICVRCKKKVVKGIVFCKYHQSKQKEYNAAARSKKKLPKKRVVKKKVIKKKSSKK